MAAREEKDYDIRRSLRGEDYQGGRLSKQDFEETDESLDFDVRRSRTYDPYWKNRRRSIAYENYSRPYGQQFYDEKDPERDYYDRGDFNDWEYERRQFTRNFGLDRKQIKDQDRDRKRSRRPEQGTQFDREYDPVEEENREPEIYYEEWWIVPGPYEGVGPRDYQRSDERIFEEVCERITLHGQIDARNVDIKVDNGEVSLTGTVNDRRSKRLIEDTIETVPGLVDIHNELRVQNKRQGSD